MKSKSKDDGLLDGLDDEDTAPTILALIAGLLVGLAALLLPLA